ncbi:MAG: hypothetical protein ABIL62_07600 [Planctomycetota bacterium]
MNPVEQMLKFLGELLLYGGGIVGIVLLFLRFLGKRWIENIFSENLEKYKNELNKELEQYRYKINALFNRVTKIHEIEFEVLPEAWLKMQDALGRISGLVSIIKSWPDLDRMSQTAIEEFLAKSKLHEYEKDELCQASRKLDYYQKTIFWHDLREVQNAFDEFHNYIIRNKIFLSPDLQAKFAEIDDIMWTAIVHMKVGKGSDSQEISQDMCINAYKKIRDDVNPIRDNIEKLVQSRLHYHDVD